MFKYIIKNFQSLKDVKIAVDGFTLIIGQTGEGKSASFRALRAAIENKWSRGQVRYGEKTATVAMQMDGHTVVASKDEKGSPSMTLDGTVFSKLNRTVPEQIADTLNMSPISADGNYSLNLYQQFEPPLLVGFSQKKVLDLLSASEALDDLNIVKGELSVKRSETNGAFKSLDSILTSLKEQDSALESQVKAYTPVLEQINSVSRELDENVQTCRMYNELYDLIEQTQKMDELCQKYDAWLQNTEQVIQDYSEVSKRVSEVRELLSTVDATESYKEQWHEIKESTLMYELIVDNQKRQNDVRNRLVDLSTLAQCLDLKADYDARKNELEQVVDGNICPICGRPMSQCEDSGYLF